MINEQHVASCPRYQKSTLLLPTVEEQITKSERDATVFWSTRYFSWSAKGTVEGSDGTGRQQSHGCLFHDSVSCVSQRVIRQRGTG